MDGTDGAYYVPHPGIQFRTDSGGYFDVTAVHWEFTMKLMRIPGIGQLSFYFETTRDLMLAGF